MRYELRFPQFDRRVRVGRVVSWLKGPDDEVGYGDPLVDVAVDEFTTLHVHRSAKLVTRLAKRRVETGAKTTKMTIVTRIVSSDRGFLRSIESPEGSSCEVGEVLAVLSTTADEDLAAAPVGTFRVVTSPIEAGREP